MTERAYIKACGKPPLHVVHAEPSATLPHHTRRLRRHRLLYEALLLLTVVVGKHHLFRLVLCVIMFILGRRIRILVLETSTKTAAWDQEMTAKHDG